MNADSANRSPYGRVSFSSKSIVPKPIHSNSSRTVPFKLNFPESLFQAVSAKTSRRFRRHRVRHRPTRQLRAPTVAFRRTGHLRSATAASCFHTPILSCRPKADATSNLWQTQCLRGMVFAQWSVRPANSVGPARFQRELTGLSCRYKPKWIQSSYAIFVLLRTSTTANLRSPIVCSK
jgi:hypothetical protein